MIIHRVTTDMFEFADVCSHMVNPVNLLGVPGAGLALEFRKRVPSYVDTYRLACKKQDLRIGTVQVIDDTDQDWSIINFPTKRHYQDTSSPEDIQRGLEALRNLLTKDPYKHAVVGMPMLGCGLGKQDYQVVYPMMMDYLDDIEATVFLSMAPEKTDLTPKYLTIAGPLDYGRDDKERSSIDWVISKTLESWGTSVSDYTGVVSGGYSGVDAYVCGTQFNQNYTDTYVYRHTQNRPLVCKPNTDRNGVGSNLHLGNLLCEIADDVILFKPKGHNNNRLSAMQIWLEADGERRQREGLFAKRISIFGDKGVVNTSQNVIVPQLEDIPY